MKELKNRLCEMYFSVEFYIAVKTSAMEHFSNRFKVPNETLDMFFLWFVSLKPSTYANLSNSACLVLNL